MSVSCVRIQIKEDGRKRKLIIKDCKVTDAGLYSCVSNADKTEAEIVINCKYSLFQLLSLIIKKKLYVITCNSSDGICRRQSL